MKQITIAICFILLSSCNKTKAIYTKNYDTKYKCICNYTYIKLGNTIWFQDSCNRYNIGDTIK